MSKQERTFDKKDLTLREKWSEIIFESHTKDSRLFDVILLWAILLSVITIMASSVEPLMKKYSTLLISVEWIFTGLFTIEYIARVILSPDRRKYILSIWGIIDLLSTIPTYLSLFVHGPQYLLILRIFRLMRIFRILRLTSFLKEARSLTQALRASSAKIIVFFGVILSTVIIMGTLMYLIEGPAHGFTSIPKSVYWAIVTMTTVGYGDFYPVTAEGRVIAGLLMVTGISAMGAVTGAIANKIITGTQTDKDVEIAELRATVDELQQRSALPEEGPRA